MTANRSPKMTAKAGMALLLVTVLLSAPFALTPAAAVSCPGGRLVTNDDTGATHCSLQTAIDAARAGETLLVSPGTYAEAITIPAGKDGLTIAATDVRTATIALPGPGDVLKVKSDDVTLYGLSITNDFGGAAILARANDLVLRENHIDGILNVPAGLGILDVDARLNQWGVSTVDDVLARVHAPGGFALVSPFLDADGNQDPPAPRITDGTHCGGAGFAPRFIEEAIWCSHAGETISLHPSSSPASPTPYQPTPDGFFGNPAGNLVFKNRGLSGVTAFGEPIWGSGFTPVGSDGGELLAGLTVCSGAALTSGQDPPEPGTGPCANDPAGVVIDPIGNTDSALDVRADSVSVSALTIQNSGDADDLNGLIVRATGVEVTGNDIAGNFMLAEHNGGATIDQIGLMLMGAASDDALIADNTVHNWRNIGLYLSNSAGDGATIAGNTVTQNRWTGILLEGPDGGALDVRGNSIGENGDSGIRFGATDASDWRIRQNAIDLTNLFGISIQAGTTGTTIDLRLNDWGVDDRALLADRVDDESGTNTVLQVPYLSPSGHAEPGLPRVAGVPAADCDAHPDAEFVAGFCRIFTVQAALDLATSGDDIFVPRSAKAADPTPHLGQLDMNLGRGGSVLSGVTICGATGGLLCAPDHEAGHFEVKASSFETPDILLQGQSLAFDVAAGAAGHSFFPSAGLQIDDIDALRYDIFATSGVCAGGNGRISLGIDTNGDGARDGNVEVDATKSCPIGEWTTIDLMANPATTWTGSGFGIPAGSQAAAHSALVGINPDYQIAAVNLQLDAGTLAGWFDNVQLNGFLLGEQNDIDCGFPVPANCRQDGAMAATLLQSDSGTFLIDMDQDDQTLRGLTVRRTGDPGGHAYGVRMSHDRATLDGVQVLMQGGGCDANGCGDAAQVTALFMTGDDATVKDSYIAADLFSTETGVFGGVNGAIGPMGGALFEGNTFRAWRSNHVFVQGDDVTIQSNSFESVGSTGVLVCSGNDNVQVLANTFQGLADGVGVCGTPAPTNLELHDNTFGLTNQLGVSVRSGTAAAFVDAECNDWGAYHLAAIEATRIDDANDPSTNVVDASPFTSPDANGLECLIGPTADFTASPTTTDRRTVVEFQDASVAGSRPIVSWMWDFGDGTTSVLPIANHTYETVGTFTVTLTVTDLQGMRSSATETIVVKNLKPIFPAIPDINVQEFGTVTIPLAAKDPDGDNPVSFILVQAPAGAVLTDNGNGTGEFTWTAGASTLETVKIRAKDSHSPSAKQLRSFDITVGTGFDIAPVLDPIVNQVVQETANLLFAISGSDADGDPLTLSISPMPAGATLTQTGPTTWVFDWTPSLSQQGVHTLSAVLSDGQLSDSQSFTITVDNLDQAPLISSFPGMQHVPNAATQSWYVLISDADNDPVSFTATGIPGGGALSDNGQGRARIDWPASATGTTGTICVTATAGGVPVSECFDVLVTGWVDLELTGGDFVYAAPGQAVTLTAQVRNVGTSPAVVDFASEADNGWATTTPAPVVLYGGEAKTVSFDIVAGSGGSQSRIKFTAATSDNPGEAEHTYWRVFVPVMMDVEITKRDGIGAVEGIVRTTFVDGSPAPNVRLTLTDRPTTNFADAFVSTVEGVSDANGVFAFSMGIDSLNPGGHMLGRHELTVDAERFGRVDTLVTEYVIGPL